MTDGPSFISDETIAQQVADAQRRAEQAQDLAQRVEQVRAQASSPRDELTVTVDSLGRLDKLDLTPRAIELGAEALAAAIVDAAGRARTQAGQQVVEMSAELWGADSQTVAMLRDTYLPAQAPTEDTPGQQDPFSFGR